MIAMADSDIIEVFSTINATEAHLVKNLLESVGIEATIVDEHMAVAIGGWNSVPRVWVAQADCERARKVIEDWEAERRTGEPKPSSPPWTCPRCGEETPGSFDVCWNCNYSRTPTST
jgi:hypothetical protein